MKYKTIFLVLIVMLLLTGCGLKEDSYYLKPELNPSTSSRKYKTNYNKANEIVLNGVTYALEEDKLQKYLDNGFIIDGDFEEEIVNSMQIRGHFPAYPDAKIYLDFHTPDHRTKTKSRDCVVDEIKVYFPKNSAGKYHYKFINFVIDENTTKTEVNNYFNLLENGSKTVMLYTDKYLINLQCGSIYETHEYSNSFQIEIFKYNENIKIPEFAQ